jgi:hypothetical protein
MKSELKKELLKMLKSDMMEESKKGKADLFKEYGPKKAEKMAKVTVMGDSPEAVAEGLSKAQQIMKAKLGKVEMEDEDEKYEKKCPMCKGKPCECEAPDDEY